MNSEERSGGENRWRRGTRDHDADETVAEEQKRTGKHSRTSLTEFSRRGKIKNGHSNKPDDYIRLAFCYNIKLGQVRLGGLRGQI